MTTRRYPVFVVHLLSGTFARISRRITKRERIETCFDLPKSNELAENRSVFDERVCQRDCPR